ncbi:phosphate ABC transporter substrate-binding protein [Candidatus Omnitrophus magneticus]|uniref:Phosphate ABC transporter substrate-binding protein n=1 Tax=Candidatus Omnitrophus magneticus TaxID=1609969 RepID=A0A0F0CP25_9BACT|nr:phosphate ABC transporter substrate-binding protein [Candidatus Omnitrophus magneticus]
MNNNIIYLYKTTKQYLCLTVIAVMCLLTSDDTAFSEELTIEGSNTFCKRVLNTTRSAIKQATGIQVTVNPTSTSDCIMKLIKEKRDYCASSVHLDYILRKGNIDNKGYQEHFIANYEVVPIVNKNNPVENLTWKQISAIAKGDTRNWKDVGGSDMEIYVFTYNDDEWTRQMFEEIVMNKDSFTGKAKILDSDKQMVSAVSSIKGAFGIISKRFVMHHPESTMILKTDEISQPLSLITRGNPSNSLQSIIQFLKTPKARALFD